MMYKYLTFIFSVEVNTALCPQKQILDIIICFDLSTLRKVLINLCIGLFFVNVCTKPIYRVADLPTAISLLLA